MTATEQIKNLTDENAVLRSRLDAANGQIANLQYEVAYLRKQMFGRKTETRKVILSDGTEVTEIDLFNEAEAEAMPNAPELEAATPVKGHVRRKKQKLSKEELLKTIPHGSEPGMPSGCSSMRKAARALMPRNS